ncbi:prephenate dehydrogenase [uncultured Clostridium sp.]|jgi:prephenate dehydrogenase|uniref:prephenate dehydrogenase n=1 Tax=uncultured Clostridium sp. TaxID=59620 RepID=UPI00262CC6D0|nr:prephenate dehydrogenase [uncultured Clostridium sp.]
MNITLVGLGVIGGSIGLSLRGKIYGVNIQGIDIKRDTIVKAFELGIIEKGATIDTPEEIEILKEADMIILSIYPDAIKDFIENHKGIFKKDLIIVDTSGVKNHLKDIEIPEGVDFVLTHPMAGREKKGIEYASRKVFIDANFIITRTEKNKDENIEEVKFLAKKMGFSTIVETNADLHDEIIAFTSQLPHAIAVSLMNSDDLSVDTGSFTGDSYKEITRIANINEDLWCELFISNKENLANKIDSFILELEKLKKSVVEEDRDTLKSKFIEATTRRTNL